MSKQASVISYLRVSTNGQGKSSLGLELQREMIARFAAAEVRAPGQSTNLKEASLAGNQAQRAAADAFAANILPIAGGRALAGRWVSRSFKKSVLVRLDRFMALLNEDRDDGRCRQNTREPEREQRQNHLSFLPAAPFERRRAFVFSGSVMRLTSSFKKIC